MNTNPPKRTRNPVRRIQDVILHRRIFKHANDAFHGALVGDRPAAVHALDRIRKLGWHACFDAASAWATAIIANAGCMHMPYIRHVSDMWVLAILDYEGDQMDPDQLGIPAGNLAALRFAVAIGNDDRAAALGIFEAAANDSYFPDYMISVLRYGAHFTAVHTNRAGSVL